MKFAVIGQRINDHVKVEFLMSREGSSHKRKVEYPLLSTKYEVKEITREQFEKFCDIALLQKQFRQKICALKRELGVEIGIYDDDDN